MGSNPAGRARFLLQHQRPEANTTSGRFTSVGTFVGTRASRMIEASDTLFACFSSVIFSSASRISTTYATELLEPPSVAVLEASLLMWGFCRSAPSALRVSFASKSNHAVLALRAYRT